MANQPTDVVIVGSALNTLGFEANLTVAGLGLATKGFLWPCSGIWYPSDDSTLSTTWVPLGLSSSNPETCQDFDTGSTSPSADLTTEGGDDIDTESGEKIST